MARIDIAVLLPALLAGSLFAQSGPVRDDLVKAASALEATETKILQEFEKPAVDAKAVAAHVAAADAQLKSLRKSLEEIDANYDKLPEEQKTTVRTCWDLTMILTAYLEDQKESSAQPASSQRREDDRITAQCAARRAGMLKESLATLKLKS